MTKAELRAALDAAAELPEHAEVIVARPPGRKNARSLGAGIYRIESVGVGIYGKVPDDGKKVLIIQVGGLLERLAAGGVLEAKVGPRGKGMEEEEARQVASALDGEAYDAGEGEWLAVFRKPGGGLVVIDDDTVGEFADEEAFKKGAAVRRIELG
jgi:hypothetical protein